MKALRFLGLTLLLLVGIGLTVKGETQNQSADPASNASVDPPAERPNILFALADDVSFPHMGARSPSWIDTPNFNRVARNGLLFNRTYTPNDKCAPSRAAILTGRNSWQLEQAANHWAYWPNKFSSYAEALANHGYFVGHSGKGWKPGVAKQGGETRYLAGQPFEKYTTDPPTNAISENDYAANFRDFLNAVPDDQPFTFWYGSHEPHRGYEYGTGRQQGGKHPDAISSVPPYWPDTDSVRTDMLDYAFELEYFDRQLGRMLDMLEQRGELENTLVVVTADNGMPFPRAKGQEYEMGNHLPLAIMWGAGIKNPGRVIEDHVSFIDFAPTFLDVAGVDREDTEMKPITGQSLTDIFNSRKAGQIDPERDHVLIGKERHDVGRPHDRGYPIRGIITDDYLYLRNFKPNRWPSGPPQTGYLNTDGSPTKTAVLNARRGEEATHNYWKWTFGKRPQEEMYRLSSDPANLDNLAGNALYGELKNRFKNQLFSELKEQRDPRMFGNGDVFDDYAYADTSDQNFYRKFMNGTFDRYDASWVNPSDFEPNFSKPTP